MGDKKELRCHTGLYYHKETLFLSALGSKMRYHLICPANGSCGLPWSLEVDCWLPAIESEPPRLFDYP